jgi:hypothetical protein
MKRWIAIATLLCSVPCLFAASKTVKQQTGVLIASPFTFQMQGDGISVTLTMNPLDIPQGSYGPALPHLLPEGVSGIGQTCNGGVTISTASLSGHQLTVNFSAPPPESEIISCTVYLLFHP